MDSSAFKVVEVLGRKTREGVQRANARRNNRNNQPQDQPGIVMIVGDRPLDNAALADHFLGRLEEQRILDFWTGAGIITAVVSFVIYNVSGSKN